MKKLALLAVFGLLTLSSSAQKVGHINSQKLLSLMPERTTAETLRRQKKAEQDKGVEDAD